MGLSSLFQWWEEWQLRILVLGSLLLQLQLSIASKVRNGRNSRTFRLCTWLAYLGADASAIYALATLFNRHGKQQQQLSPGGSTIEVLWAPVLLIHLGGQHPLTAYSIEDNQLWRRHIATLVSQVTVALYVFCRSWPSGGDKRLLHAAIFLFIIGTFKFVKKPLSLRRAASFARLMTASPQEGRTDFVTGWSFQGGRAHEQHDLLLEDYVKRAKELATTPGKVDDDNSVVTARDYYADINLTFVDLAAPYPRRLNNLQNFLCIANQGLAYDDLSYSIRIAFNLIYTSLKLIFNQSLKKLVFTPQGMLWKLLGAFLTLPPVVLFATSRKDGYASSKIDIKITYILLSSTCFLEFLYVIPTIFTFSNRIAQHNIVTLYAHKSCMLMRLAALLGCEEFVSKNWYSEERASEGACIELTDLVIEHVKDGWTQYIHDGAGYKRFTSLRGEWAMSRHKICDQRLWSSLLQLPFDQSILIWHLATELCLHHPRTSPAVEAQGSGRRSRIISNYMISLLFRRPEMLMPGTRQGLFMTAYSGIVLMLKSFDEPPSQDQGTIARRILRMAKFPWLYNNGAVKGSLVPRACELVECLMEVVSDETERWKMIQGVWVEMLCHSASRCRGYLHAKSMGDGVQLLTVVWLLLSRMGMEAFADKFQRPNEEIIESLDSGVFLPIEEVNNGIERSNRV